MHHMTQTERIRRTLSAFSKERGQPLVSTPSGAPSWSQGSTGPRRHRYVLTARGATGAIRAAFIEEVGLEVGGRQAPTNEKTPAVMARVFPVRWPRSRP